MSFILLMKFGILWEKRLNLTFGSPWHSVSLEVLTPSSSGTPPSLFSLPTHCSFSVINAGIPQAWLLGLSSYMWEMSCFRPPSRLLWLPDRSSLALYSWASLKQRGQATCLFMYKISAGTRKRTWVFPTLGQLPRDSPPPTILEMIHNLWH